jgi:hypothetical protein
MHSRKPAPARDPRDVPTIGTAQGPATAANPDDVVSDKAPQTSADLAANANPSGLTAESGAPTTGALATVAKSPAPDKASKDTITKGLLPGERTHSTGDFAAPEPSPSYGRSIKDILVFGPSEWDVCLLSPYHIHPGAQIRPARRIGQK